MRTIKTPTPVRLRTAKPRKPEVFKLRLYVAGQTPKSIRAFANLKVLCEEHLKGRYHIEVIDLRENPQLARARATLVPILERVWRAGGQANGSA